MIYKPINAIFPDYVIFSVKLSHIFPEAIKRKDEGIECA